MAGPYYVDYISGDDTAAGTSTGTAWKHDPDMANATSVAGAVTLVGGDDIIYLGDTGSSIEWALASGCGVDVRAAVNGITRQTRSGDFPVIFEYRVFPAAIDWTYHASDVWKTSLELTTSAHAKRFFIEDVSPNLTVPLSGETEADVVARLTADRPVYMTNVGGQNYVYMHTGGSTSAYNPSTLYGAGNLSFVRASGAANAFLYRAGTYAVPVEDHVLDNIIIRGTATGVAIGAYHNNITVQNCRSEMWGRGGFSSAPQPDFADLSGKVLPYIGVPNRHIVFDACVADMVTQRDEWPNEQGERGGDSFSISGPHIGGRIINCHAQDQHHTAFSVQGYNHWAHAVPELQVTPGYTHGTIGCEIGWCTADNRNSFYGRLIGSVGSNVIATYSYNNAYGIIHHNSSTNMQTRSQISGDNLKVYSNNFSNVIGTRTQFGTDYPGETRSGEGLTMASSEDADGTGYGSKTLTNCEVFKNTFSNNRLAGLHVSYGYTTGTDGGNTFRDNLFLDNNLLLSDEDTNPPVSNPNGNWQHCQILITGTIPGTDNYNDNLMEGGTTEVVGYGNTAATETVTEFNAETYADGNTNTITNVDYEGIPRTGSNVTSFGTIPTLVTATNLIPAADRNDFDEDAVRSGSQWNNPTPAASVIPDTHGTNHTAVWTQSHSTPADAGTNPLVQNLSCSFLIGPRPEMVFTDSGNNSFDSRLNDGVNPSDTSANGNMVTNTMVYHTHTYTGTASTATRNYFYLRSRSQITYPDWHVNLADVRMAYEDASPDHPLGHLYNDFDLTDDEAQAPRDSYTGNDPGANAHVGAYYTLSGPVVPDIMEDAFGNGYTEATAEARLIAYLFTKGTVTTAYDATVPINEVISQGTAAGTTGAIDDTVDFVVSLGPAPGGIDILTNRRNRR